MSRRRSPLPKGWAKRRKRTLKRDGYRCRLRLQGCTVIAGEVHHAGHRDDHRDEVLLSACSSCHATETGRQARAAQLRGSRTRPQERHPGLVD